MSFNPHTLGRRLREARENCGLSQQVAADSIGIPRTAVTQLEAGNRAVSTLELAQLAELYKQPVANFFGEQPRTASVGSGPRYPFGYQRTGRALPKPLSGRLLAGKIIGPIPAKWPASV